MQGVSLDVCVCVFVCVRACVMGGWVGERGLWLLFLMSFYVMVMSCDVIGCVLRCLHCHM